jgi:hypothetical protein
MSSARFDDLSPLGQTLELRFEFPARNPSTGEFSQQLLERGAAMRQRADMVQQGRSHDPLYW